MLRRAAFVATVAAGFYAGAAASFYAGAGLLLAGHVLADWLRR